MKKKIIFLLIPFLFSCAKKQLNKSLSSQYLQESATEAKAGNYPKAIYLADQAYKNNPIPHILALKATLFYQVKNFSESLKLFKSILDDKNTPPQLRTDVMNNYACTLLCVNKKDEAKAIWQQLARDKYYLSPEVAWFNLGLLEFSDAMMFKQDKDDSKRLQANMHFAQAAKKFQEAITIACHYIDAYYYLALSQEQLQQYELAKENLITILGKVPNHEAAATLLKRVDKKLAERVNESMINPDIGLPD